ncbi:MAG: MATE family efflux transporter, partial [Bacteroidia bacterium]
MLFIFECKNKTIFGLINALFLRQMKDFTEGKEAKLILQFAIPILLASMFHQLYNVVDSIFIGQFVNKEGLVA